MTVKITNFSQPFILFNEWLKAAKSNPHIKEPTAMALATVDDENRPSVRMILLKKFDESGFCFFTNLTSRKARDLIVNPNVSLCFYWMQLGYQVRIEGKVEKVSIKEADAYFTSRRRGSQIGAWASKQSQEMVSEEEFEKRIEQITEDFKDQVVPRPPFWSGFRVIPDTIEFWEEGEYRLHTRTLYSKLEDDKGWKVINLYP